MQKFSLNVINENTELTLVYMNQLFWKQHMSNASDNSCFFLETQYILDLSCFSNEPKVQKFLFSYTVVGYVLFHKIIM